MFGYGAVADLVADMVVRAVQAYLKARSSGAFRDNRITGIITLMKDDSGAWKIFNQTADNKKLFL